MRYRRRPFRPMYRPFGRPLFLPMRRWGWWRPMPFFFLLLGGGLLLLILMMVFMR